MVRKKHRKKSRQTKVWKTFEDAARSIIAQHPEVFGLENVEPAVTKIQGQSGQEWNIDVVGYSNGSRKVVIFEVRRKKKNIEPEEIAGLLGRIEETQAQKGYIVTRLDRGLSIGSQKVAGFHKIGHIQVSVDATPDAYVMRYLKQVFVSMADTMQPSDSLAAIVRDKDGNIIQQTSSGEKPRRKPRR
jgi:hypothetical protein